MKNFYQKKILIIKFGGLGDFFLSLNPFYTIRKSHSKDHLILLTQKPYDQIAKKSDWFDEIFTIKRSIFYFLDIIKIMKQINIDKIDSCRSDTKRHQSFFAYYFGTCSIRLEWCALVR